MNIEETVGDMLRKKGLTLSIAESCTGGLISHTITNVSGCSDYFECAMVVYSNRVKEELLNVNHKTLDRFGAVSNEAAIEMARGVRRKSGADIGLSVTGIAGPKGGRPEKPVGLVYIALSTKDKTICKKNRFNGSREEIKFQTAKKALSILKEFLIGVKSTDSYGTSMKSIMAISLLRQYPQKKTGKGK